MKEVSQRWHFFLCLIMEAKNWINFDYAKIELHPIDGDWIYSNHIAFMTMYHAERSDLFVQGELEFRQINTQYIIKSDLITDLRTFEDQKISRYLLVPLMGGYLTDRIKLGAGPVLAIILNQNELFEDLLYFSEQRKPLEAYTRFVVGGLISNIDIELFYEYHFNGAADKSDVTTGLPS